MRAIHPKNNKQISGKVIEGDGINKKFTQMNWVFTEIENNPMRAAQKKHAQTKSNVHAHIKQ